LNGLYLEFSFSLKPFQIFAPILVLVFFAKNSVSTNRSKIMLQIYDVFFLMFLVIALISLMYLTNINILASLRLIANLSILYLYYLFAKNILARKHPVIIVTLVLFSSLIYAFLSLLFYAEAHLNILGMSDLLTSRDLGLVIIGAKEIRMSGLEIDPNFFALYLTPGLLLSFWTVLSQQDQVNKKLSYIVLLLSLICLGLSLSRAGILANIFFMVLTILFIFKRIKFKHLLVVSIIMSVVSGIFYQDIMVRLKLLEAEIGSIGMGRYNLLLFGLDLFEQYPFFGIGFNQFPEYFSVRFGEIRYSHNTYLSVLVELGILGLIAYIGFLILIIKSLYKFVYLDSNRWIYQSFMVILLSQYVQISSLYAISSSALWLSIILCSSLVLYFRQIKQKG
jgi:O-antigen ligase